MKINKYFLSLGRAKFRLFFFKWTGHTYGGLGKILILDFVAGLIYNFQFYHKNCNYHFSPNCYRIKT